MSTTPVIEDVRNLVAQAVETARQDGLLRLETMPDIRIEHPGNPDHGDFATNLPLRLARATRINPLDLANALVDRLPESAPVSPGGGGCSRVYQLPAQGHLAARSGGGSPEGRSNLRQCRKPAQAAVSWLNLSASTRRVRSMWATPGERCSAALWPTSWSRRAMMSPGNIT